jgi:hypothetical protein
MLVPPLVVSRPGENHTPASGCEILGYSLPADGPYACYLGRNYSKQGVKELAKPLGLLVTEDAQVRFENVLAQLAEATQTVKGRGEEIRELSDALKVTTAELAIVTAERDKAVDQLAKVATSASITRDAVSQMLNPKKKEPAHV